MTHGVFNLNTFSMAPYIFVLITNEPTNYLIVIKNVVYMLFLPDTTPFG
jgi:hypothetical protein